MKPPTLTAIFLTVTLSACGGGGNSPSGGATYTATATSTDFYNLCLRAANRGTGSRVDNQEFFQNCLRQNGLETTDNGGVVNGVGQDKPRIGSPDQRGEITHLSKRGNTYYVPVRINDTITLPFLLDTGASDLVIPVDVALTLMRAGALKRSDFIGQTSYLIANGSEQVSDVVVLRDVRVGDRMVRNVRASITAAQGEPLLGQSFLSKFGSVTLDYNRLILVLSP